MISTQEMIQDSRERRKHNVNQFSCEQCDFKSASKTLLNRHNNSAHKEFTVSCEQCNFKSSSKAHLNRHKNSAHEKHIP